MNYLIGTAIALGLLIFVHELGHFLLAKRAGVGVQKFSLGFGPKLIGKKWGETEYVISAFPLGGYVKLEGESPDDEVADKQKSFTHKPPFVKLSIVAAGPLFNIIFAVLIITAIYAMGITTLSPFVADVEKGMPADKAGLKYGDEIVAIDGSTINSWEEMTGIIHTSGGKSMELTINREGKTFKKTVTPVEKEAPNIFGEKSKISLLGILPITLESKIGGVKKGLLAEKLGFKPGDLIKNVGNKKIEVWKQLEEIDIANIPKPVEIILQRQRGEDKENSKDKTTEDIKIEIPDNEIVKNKNLIDLLGIETTELYIEGTKEGSPAELGGLKPFDKIIGVNGNEIKSWMELNELIKNNPEKKVDLIFERGGEKKSLSLIPRKEKKRNIYDEKIDIGVIGIYSANSYTEPKLKEVKYPLHVAFVNSVERTENLVVIMFKGIYMLVTGKVSSKNISGPIAIAKMAGDQAKKGLNDFAFFVAFISINLGIVNFIPLGTITDGGLILLFIIEGIIRKPVNLKFREFTQYIGLVLVFALMGFAIYNDFNRYLGDIIDFFARFIGNKG